MISNSIKEEMYAQAKTVGTRRVHTLYGGQYLYAPKTNTVSIKTLGNTVPDKLFHLSSEI